MFGFDPMFVGDSRRNRPPPLPGSWDAFRVEARSAIQVQGRWEGALSSVLEATRRGGFTGDGNLMARSKRLGVKTPQEYLLSWLRQCRMDWSLDEATDRLVLLKRERKASKKIGVLPPAPQEGEQPTQLYSGLRSSAS